MKKKVISILLITVCATGLAVYGHNYKSKVKGDQKPVVIENQNKTDDNIISFKSEDLDFSNVSYEKSETARDEKLEKAITEALDYNKETDGVLRYYYNKVDLNGDEKPEIFTYLVGPYVSGSGGSTALIFENKNDEYQLATKLTLVRNPIIISDNSTNGWKDLIMYISGGGIEPFYSQVQFDGNEYTGNPSVQPEIESGTIVKGTAIIADDLLQNSGIEIQ